MTDLIPPDILARHPRFRGATARPFGSGLINRTYLVEAPGGARAVFQRLHPTFSGAVNEDIDAVTRHLAAKGLVTPRLLRTEPEGAAFALDAEGHVWRALSFVEGHSFDRLTSAGQAHQAGALVAQFHAALCDFSDEFHNTRVGVHDTAHHLAALERAVAAHPAHRLHAAVAPLADAVLREAPALLDASALPRRVCHGDLKISNLLFRSEQALCLVDLDTVGPMIWPFEMGDALRSWCNRAGEDEAEPRFSIELFTAAIDGYGQGARAFLSREEALFLVEGVSTICLELAARFLADALNESYFGHDPRRFPAAGEHNLLRGQGQLALYRDVLRQRAALERRCQAAFALS